MTGTANTGTVKWFNEQKGYGFITPDGREPDVFFHVSALQKAGIREVREGDRLQYDLETNPKKNKLAAVNLRLVSKT